MAKVSVNRMFVLVGLYGIFANLAHPITPTLIMNLNLGDYMFGVAYAAMSIVNFTISPFWGKTSSQIGVVKISAISFVGYAIGQAVFATATTELQIIVGRMIAGLFISGIMVGHLIYIMAISPKEKRGVNLAISATISAVFSPFGYLIGGFIGDYSIPLVFIIQVIGLLLLGVIYLMFLKDKPMVKDKLSMRQLVKQANPFSIIIDSKKIMTPTIICFFSMAFFATLAVTSHEQVFNFFINDQFELPPSFNGIIKAMVGFMALLANSTICLWIMKKTNVQKSIVGIFLILFISMGLLMVINTQNIFIFQNLLIFGLIAIYLPVIQAVLAIFSKGDNGLMIGMFNSVKSLGMVVGSLFAGFIYSVDPLLPFFIAMLAFGIAMILGIINYKQCKVV